MDTRAPPPQGRFAFNRVYRTNLRPIIIALGTLSALWSLLSGIGFFRSINTAKQDSVPKLATFAIVFGAIYMAIFVIEFVGIVASVSQRLALVRIYAYLSLVAIGLTFGGGIFQVVVHFTSKADILKECTDVADGRISATYPGFLGPSHHDFLNPGDASDWCNNAYDRSSWADIVSLLITIFLACSFSFLAWGYYRQVLDPTSVVNSLRAPLNQTRLNNYPSHYNPPYNASVPNLGYGYNAPYAGAPYAGGPQTYAPPPGAPPTTRDAPFAPPETKPPGYTGGDGAVGYGVDDKENPFADFDERTERDVTSRPAPGGQNTFR
ncbi:hypothetical protein DFH09DRAFT_190383 [Mycena vulgaris]|nr:hypothetical protein DFH09DRAFT_190383 [Mycena vulgaris]